MVDPSSVQQVVSVGDLVLNSIRAVAVVVVVVLGWVWRVERRVAGIPKLERKVARVDRRVLRILIKVDPDAADEELGGDREGAGV